MKRQYPLEPLAVAMGESLSSLGHRLGVSGGPWKQYHDNGVSWKVADRLATRAGFYPGLVWPEWIDELIEGAQIPCKECGCGFIPADPRQIFCTPKCRKRRNRRDSYRSDPELRRREKAQKAEYRESCRDYLRARDRAYKIANREKIRERSKLRPYDPEARRARYLAKRERELERQREYDRRKRAEQAA